ncbi:MAG: RNA methyltransferase [Myxococcota bacterium]|nr:RNA methyltransferase [Myxococcota bacterium]
MGAAANERVELTGVHPVLEALRAGRRSLHRLRLRKGLRRPELAEILALARERGLAVEEVSGEALEASDGEVAPDQGMALLAGPLPEVSLEALAEGGRGGRSIVALDGVEDPQNVGAIARVAEASGAAGLLLTRRRAAPLGAAVSRASAGAIEWLPVCRVVNLRRALEALKELGFWVFGCDPEGAEDLFRLPDRVRSGERVVLLGAEGRGLRAGVRAAVDHPVRIPMAGRVASLNVATTAAIVLFELARREA